MGVSLGGLPGPGADAGKSQPLLLNSSMYLRSSGDRGGVTSSWPGSSLRVLTGRNGELSIKRWKSLMEHTDLALCGRWTQTKTKTIITGSHSNQFGQIRRQLKISMMSFFPPHKFT